MAPGLGDLADVFAEIQQGMNGALRVHDAAGTDGVAHALIDAIFQRDIDIGFEGFQPALADGADHIIGILQAPRGDPASA